MVDAVNVPGAGGEDDVVEEGCGGGDLDGNR